MSKSFAVRIEYRCCSCDENVTDEVRSSCGTRISGAFLVRGSAPGERKLRAQTFQLKAQHNVIATCSNGHTCEYPCQIELDNE